MQFVLEFTLKFLGSVLTNTYFIGNKTFIAMDFVLNIIKLIKLELLRYMNLFICLISKYSMPFCLISEIIHPR